MEPNAYWYSTLKNFTNILNNQQKIKCFPNVGIRWKNVQYWSAVHIMILSLQVARFKNVKINIMLSVTASLGLWIISYVLEKSTGQTVPHTIYI